MSTSRTSTIVAVAAAFFAVTGMQAAAPVIQGVANAANYQPGIASAAWVAITGTNLAMGTQVWGAANFMAGNLPTTLGDVKGVTINGVPAYIYFISPGQINVLAPDDPATGRLAVQVTNSQGSSNSFTVSKQTVAPALFAFSQRGGIYGVIQASLSYGLVGPPLLIGPTTTTAVAVPGEQLILYGTGMGPVSPPQPTGKLVEAPAPTATPVTVTIGGRPATVQFAGLIGSGLYQINVIVPIISSGDALIVVSVNGTQSAGSVYVPVQSPNPTQQTEPALSGCLSGQVDYIKYSTSLLYYGDTTELSIGGTKLCSTCNILAPIFPEFTARLERALLTKNRKNVQACYDKYGNVYQVSLANP